MCCRAEGSVSALIITCDTEASQDVISCCFDSDEAKETARVSAHIVPYKKNRRQPPADAASVASPFLVHTSLPLLLPARSSLCPGEVDKTAPIPH